MGALRAFLLIPTFSGSKVCLFHLVSGAGLVLTPLGPLVERSFSAPDIKPPGAPRGKGALPASATSYV